MITWLTGALADEQARGENLGHFSIGAPWLDCPATRAEPLGDLEWGPDACDCGRDRKRADILAGVEADRAILAEHAQVKASGGRGAGCRTCDSGFDGYSVREGRGECRTVLLVASRYRHRPGYMTEWAVTS